MDRHADIIQGPETSGSESDSGNVSISLRRRVGSSLQSPVSSLQSSAANPRLFASHNHQLSASHVVPAKHPGLQIPYGMMKCPLVAAVVVCDCCRCVV